MSKNDCFIVRPLLAAAPSSPVPFGAIGVFQRAGDAWYFDKNGNLVKSESDEPRYAYNPATLAALYTGSNPYTEVAATNYVRSNDGTGAVPGSPGTLPNGWSVTAATVSGISFSVVGTGTDVNGIPYTDVRLSGTNTGGGIHTIYLMPTTAMAVTAGQQVAASAFVDVVAGSVANVNIRGMFVQWYDNTQASLGTATGVTIAASGDVLRKAQKTSVPTAPASAAYARLSITSTWVGSGNAIDLTYRIGVPQLELGAAVTTPIVNSTASAKTRAAETYTSPFAFVAPAAFTNVSYPQVIGDNSKREPAAWASGIAYTVGQRAYRNVTIYECNFAHTSTTLAGPEGSNATERGYWTKVSLVNSYCALMDASPSTTTSTGNGPGVNKLVFTLFPQNGGMVADTLCFDNVTADSIRVRVLETGYDRTVQLRTRECKSWWNYFTEPFRYRRSAVFTDLPPLTTAKVLVTIKRASADTTSDPSVGLCVIGKKKSIGKPQYGARLSNTDFSVNTTDAWGNLDIEKRGFSKDRDLQVLIDNNRLDDIDDFLSQYRSTPVFYALTGDYFNSMLIYGRYESYETVIEYFENSLVNLKVKGLVTQ